MTRISVSLDEATAEAVRQAAGAESVSGWVANLVRQEVLERACEAAAEYDRLHRDDDEEALLLAGLA